MLRVLRVLMPADRNAAGTVQTIPAATIVAGDNDRQHFDAVQLGELAASIAANGLAQPPTVRPLPADLVGGERYEIVAGERRVRAMRDVLGWATIPVLVRDLTDDEAAAIMLVENVQRVDLDPLEEARAYQVRVDRGATVADVAGVAGVPPGRVRARLALLKLAPDVARFVSTRDLPLSFAALMTPLDTNRQFLALAAFQAAPISLEAFRSLCSRLVAEQDQETMFDAGDFLRIEEYVLEANAAVRVADPPAVIVREPVLGPDKVAALLGVRERTVHQWRHRGIFPAPDLQVGATPAWWESTVTAWAADTGRPLQQQAAML